MKKRYKVYCTVIAELDIDTKTEDFEKKVREVTEYHDDESFDISFLSINKVYSATWKEEKYEANRPNDSR